MKFEFILNFRLPLGNSGEAYLDKLFEAGCDDAIVGLGKKGFISLDFSREANTILEAFVSAMTDVQSAIPGIELVSGEHE